MRRARTPRFRYDAFISYSHAADGRLVPALQHGLERVARPWYLPRALHLFRDETNLSASPGLWNSIESHLAQARWFILLASPEAAKSRWVAKEVAWWLEHRGADTILVAVTDGTIRWNDAAGGFDPIESTAVPPSLRSAFSAEPLFVDLRWAREPADLSQDSVRFRSALLDIAATLRGISKDELDSEAARTHQRNLYWLAAGIFGLALATGWAWVSRDAAIRSATRTALELDVKRVVALTHSKNQANALPLAIVATARSLEGLGKPPVSATAALRHGIESSREVRRWASGGQVMDAVFEPDGKHFIAILHSNDVRRWRLDGSPAPFAFGDAVDLRDDQLSVTLTGSRNGILTRAAAGGWRAWSLAGAPLASSRPIYAALVEIAPRSGNVYAVDNAGRVHVYRNGAMAVLTAVRAEGGVPARLHVVPDESALVLVYPDGWADVRRVSDNRQLATLQAKCGEGSGLAEDGKRLIVVGCGEVRMRDLESESFETRQHASLSLVRQLTLDSAGNFAIAHEGDDRVDWFNDRGALAVDTLLGVETPRIAISPDGAWLATAGYRGGEVRLFDLRARSARSLTPGARVDVSSLDVCADRPEVFWSTQHGDISRANYLETAEPPTTWPGGGDYIEAVRCVPQGGVVSSDRSGVVAYWEAPGKVVRIPYETGGFTTIATGRSARDLFMVGSDGIHRWRIGPVLERLPSLPNPLARSSWWRLALGDRDRTLLIGTDDGSVAAIDSDTGAVRIAPRRLLQTNTWSIAPDLAGTGFVAAGAGTELLILDWSGAIRSALRTDQFLFATDAAFDSSREMLFLPAMGGEILVRDLQGNAAGPPIRNAGVNQFVHLRMTGDGYLVTGALELGVTVHDFDPRRLLALACGLLAARSIGGDSGYERLAAEAANECRTLL